MRDSDYPVVEDREFQARTWRVQRVAWAIFTIIPLLALAGLFTHGYLSAGRAGNGDLLIVDYERFQRMTRTTRFTFRFANDGSGELNLNAPFRHAYVIESIQPNPARSTGDVNGLHLWFDTLQDQPLVVEMWVKPQTFGWFELKAQSTPSPVTLHVLIYP